MPIAMNLENKIVYGLLLLAAVALAGTAVVENAVSQEMAAGAEASAPQELCVAGPDGLPVVAAPASLSACAAIAQLSPQGTNAGTCGLLPVGKRDACNQLVGLWGERQGDCADLLVSNHSSFAQGAPQAFGLCQVLAP